MSAFNQSRSTVIKIIFAAALLLLALRLFQFQVISKQYGDIANDNAYFKKITWPSRGLLLDRNGKSMVRNIAVFDLNVTPKAIKGMDTATFCRIMGIDTAEFRKKIDECRFKGGPSRSSTFQALLPFAIQAKLEEKMYAFPGFDLVQRSERSYPDKVGGNVFGFLNEADSALIAKSNGNLRSGDYAGVSGLERSYDKILRGERAEEIFVRDNKQRIVERYEDGKKDLAAVAGRNLKTFMDIKLQKVAEQLMANKLGAAVAIDPKTGGILAMATGPGYDPNLLSGNEKKLNIGRLQTDVTMPMFNFAIKGVYPPGSTFKPLGALVALDEGVMTASTGVGCGGRYRSCGGKGVACHGGGHAGNLRSAMAASCNSYFITAFRKALENDEYNNQHIGYAKWKNYMTNFGLGRRLGIDIAGEWAGNIPDTAKLTKQTGMNQWTSCTISTMGIGQDRMLATPLQMANAMCIIANKGYYYIPHFVDSIVGETKEDTILNRYRKKIQTVHIADSVFDAVFDGMEAVVTGGTAKKSAVRGIAICGKTGTSENFFRGKKQVNHSWFVCFAPKVNPTIAVAVCVLNSGQGGQFAAPIATLMVEQYLTDTIKRKGMFNEMAKKKVLPGWLKEMKYIQDSTRAFDKFEETGDSSFIRIYLPPPPIVDTTSAVDADNNSRGNSNDKELEKDNLKPEAILPNKQEMDKPKDIDSIRKRNSKTK
jgi:penicillin-binding protein 2